MPSKSKKQGTGPANIPRPQPTTKPIQGATNLINTSTISNQPGILSNAQIANRPIPTGDTTEEDRQMPTQALPHSVGDTMAAPTVNRKKQKRRAKEAAKRAEQEQIKEAYDTSQITGRNGQGGRAPYSQISRGPPKGYFIEESDYVDPDFADDSVEAEYYSGEEPFYAQDQFVQNGYQAQSAGTSKKSKKRNAKKRNSGQDFVQPARADSSTSRSTPLAGTRTNPPPTTLSNAALRAGHKMSRDQIWNTSTQAERENIKQFWLELGEEERRSLVKIEKEAVLRKMKEQQKHSCSCTVCGRKRTAIEEELEALYDSYYEELEQFANHNRGAVPHPHMLDGARSSYQVNGTNHFHNVQSASRGRIEELDDDELEDEYDEDDEEDYSEDELEDEMVAPGAPDFFTFGNSLTVKGLCRALIPNSRANICRWHIDRRR